MTLQSDLSGHHEGSTPEAHILFVFKERVDLTVLQKFIWGLVYHYDSVTNVFMSVHLGHTVEKKGPVLRSSQPTLSQRLGKGVLHAK